MKYKEFEDPTTGSTYSYDGEVLVHVHDKDGVNIMRRSILNIAKAKRIGSPQVKARLQMGEYRKLKAEVAENLQKKGQ